ncbi:hypothetical protein P22_1760 [Propionispora sp. 2/2-37]|uniref:methylated-DNA--[protein]-cysteine S-methyltransferase n=1 Tax=Propionispora sp. 2/2-37 TaxID=1677858 RepID=UPI0006BB7EE4|nr:methylated-DNA--[protein]-cysteine S-methyltransferase [Propionispora sp. 2/2-37]CUH95683.1 hypothetical protein P22_1760 [Propionispora sp. 2/2-37]
MKQIAFYQTMLGLVGIAEKNGALTDLFFGREHQPQDSVERETPLLREAAKQLKEYLAGKRKTFELALAPEGTSFRKTVWGALREIPYGETRSYKQVATVIGQPGASRAIGMANNKNPLLILIPCHRVISNSGKLVGYAAGLDVKEKLLELEKHRVRR